MGRISDWLRRKVRDPLVAELRQGATPEGVAASVSVSLAIAVNPLIGTTTIGCIIAGRLFRLNHVVMQIVNHASFVLQVALMIPFMRIGETVTGSRHIVLTYEAIKKQYDESLSIFFQKFWMAYVHGIIGWLIVAPLAAWILNFFLRWTFRRLMKKNLA